MMNIKTIFLTILFFTATISSAFAENCGNLIYIQIGSTGPGYETIVTDEPDPGLPDFILDELQLTTVGDIEQYTYTNMDTIEMHSWSENIGDADWAAFPGEDEADDIYVKFYLSKGYKEDSHSEWDCVGTQQIQKGNLDRGDEKHEWDTLNLSTYNNGGPIAPGTYNIVACVDRKYDQDNGDGEVPEKHKSNNCSTEAVFNVIVGMPPPSAPTGKSWSQLTAGERAAILEIILD